MQQIECVPNFSIGRDPDLINQIVQAIISIPEVRLLHVDSGYDANRTVFTFIGTPEAVIDSAFKATKVAVALYDMAQHRGKHPRMGVLDVCPLIPLTDIDKEELNPYVHVLAQRIGRELSIPCYLYEYSAQKDNRKNLAEIRKGEYEGWEEKIKLPGWEPDYGPTAFNAHTGVSAIGVRDFLLAYNVNLQNNDLQAAQRIAANVRESGRIIRDEDGVRRRIPGRCQALKAIGWRIEDFNKAQVSMNLVDINTTGLHQAFEACKAEAQALGIEISGSELIGMAPLSVFLEAGLYFAKKQDITSNLSERQLIAIAIESLGLNDLKPFDPDEKIIEYKMLNITS